MASQGIVQHGFLPLLLGSQCWSNAPSHFFPSPLAFGKGRVRLSFWRLGAKKRSFTRPQSSVAEDRTAEKGKGRAVKKKENRYTSRPAEVRRPTVVRLRRFGFQRETFLNTFCWLRSAENENPILRYWQRGISTLARDLRPQKKNHCTP